MLKREEGEEERRGSGLEERVLEEVIERDDPYPNWIRSGRCWNGSLDPSSDRPYPEILSVPSQRFLEGIPCRDPLVRVLDLVRIGRRPCRRRRIFLRIGRSSYLEP